MKSLRYCSILFLYIVISSFSCESIPQPNPDIKLRFYGEVLDENGRPIADVPISIRGYYGCVTLRSIETDSEGKFDIYLSGTNSRRYAICINEPLNLPAFGCSPATSRSDQALSTYSSRTIFVPQTNLDDNTYQLFGEESILQNSNAKLELSFLSSGQYPFFQYFSFCHQTQGQMMDTECIDNNYQVNEGLYSLDLKIGDSFVVVSYNDTLIYNIDQAFLQDTIIF